MSDNPLANFYRNKEIYVKLPTQGKWYTNPPKLTDDGEIGVYPMTVKDEILMSIPDSLYNSESLFELFKSIAPDIEDPYEISMPDVDVILLASRAATYDNKMRVDTDCKHCGEHNEYEVDLAMALSRILVKQESLEVELNDGLTVSLKPNTLKSIAANRIKAVNTTKMLASLGKDEVIPEEMKAMYMSSVETTAAAQFAILADNIEYVQLPDGTKVSELTHILQWLQNSTKRNVDALIKASGKINQNGIENSYDFTCSNEECGKTFKSSIEFNPAFFFNNNWPDAKQQNK
jgi:hypothetical protein